MDGWFAAWSEPDTARREALLDRLATEEMRFRDRFSLIDGLSDLRPHLAAVHRFMPGMRLEREGDVRHCQGTVLADWVARAADGTSAAAAPTSSPSAITAASKRSPVSGDPRSRTDVGAGFSGPWAAEGVPTRIQN